MRSLHHLKALTYAPTGGIVAAPTTSLPERSAVARNWDYRYCWLRDATLTLLALMNAGYYEEARAWRDWLLRAAAGDPASSDHVRPRRRAPAAECEVNWLAGYEAPAGAGRQRGAPRNSSSMSTASSLDALHPGAAKGGLPSDADWALQHALLDHLEAIWREPDRASGRCAAPPQHFTHSKVMAWVALDRAIKARSRSSALEGPVDRWRALRAHP